MQNFITCDIIGSSPTLSHSLSPALKRGREGGEGEGGGDF